ncbi:RHS repeat-associated core domain-containing protein [Chitinophaga sancti]|uniref:RHS repeat domain-containing protein n=1 Tax=Chitinophaga sancti TaxID=1004 RepID=UPI002A748C8C|nr:RHS repeat-associated core domain-containing protein [Chitinophaga sancti]WPQ61468.1 RHS repeat-associated core domain-containing protein [Chitinophaga sancti]
MTGLGSGININFSRGEKFFELSNHLGNVLSTVSDRRVGISTDGILVDHYEPTMSSSQEYYPFGMLMPGRSSVVTGGSYRYGFNGKENDNEVKGEGNEQDYGMRVYDPRVGKFLSVDPLTKSYPELTPYQFASNTPIQGIDLDGEEVKFVTYYHATQNSSPLYKVETNYGITGMVNWATIEIHKYRTIDAQGNYHYEARPSPFINHENVTTSSSGHSPGKFTLDDARIGLNAVFYKYGADRAAIVEKMYRLETSHFKSGGYKHTGTGGMEAKDGHENDAPYYGWDKSIFQKYPEFTPTGIWLAYEGPGMSGKGGNAQVTDHPKSFVILPSVTAGMMLKADYIERYNGHYERWAGLTPSVQENYKKTLSGITPQIVRELTIEYDKQQQQQQSTLTRNKN